MVESNGVAEESGVKAEEAEDVKSSDEEDPETLSGIGGADQSVGYIVHFANTIELYQRKPKIASDVVGLTILWKIVWRISARPLEKWV